ncbi:MAG: 30S ribosome-binding factor RbfA [Nitrospirota bacterium]
MKSHDYKRADRVSEQIRAELSDILLRKTKDPRIGFVTITRVKLSDDLQNARVFVSIIGDEARKKEALKGLKSGAHFMRSELGHRLRLRTAPELFFQLDESIEKGAKVLDLLRGLDIKDDEGEGE